jgi:hypothetical protein
MAMPPVLGLLTIHFASGHEKEILTSASDHERAVAAMNNGDGFRLSIYNLTPRVIGTIDVPPGAVVALTFQP